VFAVQMRTAPSLALTLDPLTEFWILIFVHEIKEYSCMFKPQPQILFQDFIISKPPQYSVTRLRHQPLYTHDISNYDSSVCHAVTMSLLLFSWRNSTLKVVHFPKTYPHKTLHCSA
jgi:hypothetical protein